MKRGLHSLFDVILVLAFMVTVIVSVSLASPPSTEYGPEIRLKSAYLVPDYEGTYQIELVIRLQEDKGFGALLLDCNRSGVNLFGDRGGISTAMGCPTRNVSLTRITAPIAKNSNDIKYSPDNKKPTKTMEEQMFEDSARNRKLYEFHVKQQEFNWFKGQTAKSVTRLFLSVPKKKKDAYRFIFVKEGKIDRIITLENDDFD
ncbi:MAG: hypothetical protein KDA65_00930 [Planctomycetaceae bacterium]|nr:hypothetical protein [Planctomycetaceae bacterium]